MFSRRQKFPFGKVVLGFTLGAVSGAVLTLLYAPLSGKKMQKKIADVTGEVVDNVQSTVRRIAQSQS